MNYKCLLNKLLSAEKTYLKTKKNKFRRYVSKCQGDEISKIHTTLTTRWYNKMKDLKDTEYRIDKPTKGYITKIYKMAEEEQFLPYKPEEDKLKIKL